MEICNYRLSSNPTNPVRQSRLALLKDPQNLLVPTGRVGKGWGEATREEQIHIVEAILRKFAHYSLEDRAIILSIVRHESGFNPRAQNPSSSAHGLFQVIDGTWRGVGLDAAHRCDIESQLEAGLKLFKEYSQRLPLERLQDQPKAVQLYALHHDGPSLAYGGDRIARTQVMPWVQRFKNYLGAVAR